MDTGKILFRAEYHQHLATFHARILFNLCIFGSVFLHPLEQDHAKLPVGQLTAAKTQRNFDFIAFTDEFVDRLHLGLVIMIIDIGTHFNFFNFLRLLALAGKVGLFLGLIFKLTDVEIFCDWRISIGGHFNEIKASKMGTTVFCA